MIVVGIDVASEKHDYTIVSSTGQIFNKHSITIKNSIEGIKKLHNDIKTFCGAMKDSNVRIGLESTGIYHLSILNQLLELGYSVMVINPSLINSLKKSKDVSPAKNDNLDSKAVCQFLLDPFIDFNPYTIKSYHIESLKSLSRERFRLIKERNKTKQAIDRYITILFPEYKSLFSNIYGESSINILSKYPSPKSILKSRNSSLSELIHGKCTVDVLTLKEKAKHSIGIDNEYIEFELKSYIQKLKFQNESIEKYDSKIKEYVLKSYPNLITIPGISFITAGLIIGEIGDISKFSNADKLMKFSGLAPIVYESGKYKAQNTKPSKMGSKYLRYALFQSANIIWQNDKTFSDYFTKKANEGKHYYVILGHIEKKLIRIIHSLMKSGNEFTPQTR